LLKDLEIPYVDDGVFSPDGKKFMITTYDNNGISIYDAASFSLLLTFYPGKGLGDVLFSPDGKVILTKEVNGFCCKLWNAKDGKQINELCGHTNIITSVHFSADSKKLVTSSWDNTVKVWDGSTGNLLFDLKGHKDKVNTAEFNADASKIVSASWDNTVKVWDAVNGKLITTIKGK
jgi:WD40 repeat protein